MIGILGASGYIGQAFVQELIDQNTSFREFSRKYTRTFTATFKGCYSSYDG